MGFSGSWDCVTFCKFAGLSRHKFALAWLEVPLIVRRALKFPAKNKCGERPVVIQAASRDATAKTSRGYQKLAVVLHWVFLFVEESDSGLTRLV